MIWPISVHAGTRGATRARRVTAAAASAVSWLHRVATNVCLTALDRGRRRDLPVGLDQADAESDGVRWLGPFPTASWPERGVRPRRQSPAGGLGEPSLGCCAVERPDEVCE